MSFLAAHHPGIRADCPNRQPAAVKNPEIGVIVRLILPVQPIPIPVQAIAVKHGEFAHSDQPSPRAGVITEFGLDMVDQLGELAVGLDLTPGQVGDDFLVGHRQHHIVPNAVLEAGHLITDLRPAAGLLPNIGGMHNRHGQFLTTNGIDLFTHDGLDPVQGSACQGQIGEDACAQLADKTRPQQELVAGGFSIGRHLPQGGAKGFRKAHGLIIAFR